MTKARPSAAASARHLAAPSASATAATLAAHDGSALGSSALGSAGHRCAHLLLPRLLRPELDLAVEWWSADGQHVPRLVDDHRNPRPQPLRSPLRLSPLHSRKAECRSGCCEFGCEFECGGPLLPAVDFSCWWRWGGCVQVRMNKAAVGHVRANTNAAAGRHRARVSCVSYK